MSEQVERAAAAAIDRLIDRAPSLVEQLQRERRSTAAWFARFDGLSRAQQVLAVSNLSRPPRSIVIGLLDRARRSALGDGGAALHYARLADRAVAASPIGEMTRRELRIGALVEVANALRVLGDLQGAARAWRHVEQEGEVPSDPLEEARLLSVRASFEDWRRESAEALRLLWRARRLFALHGDRVGLVRTLSKLAGVLLRVGEPRQAFVAATEALESLAMSDSGALRLVVVHNLACAAQELGDPDLAERLVKMTDGLARRHGTDVQRLRRDWLSGRVETMRYQFARAEARLEWVEIEFRRRGMLYDAAVVGLDLLVIDARLDLWPRMRARARELHAYFLGLGVAPEALAALVALATAHRHSEAEILIRAAATGVLAGPRAA